MFSYAKPLFYPVHVQLRDPVFGQVLLEHYGGKDSELSVIYITISHTYVFPLEQLFRQGDH